MSMEVRLITLMVLMNLITAIVMAQLPTPGRVAPREPDPHSSSSSTLPRRPPPPPPPLPPPAPGSKSRSFHPSPQSFPSPPTKKHPDRKINIEKKIGLLFIGIATILQVAVVGFLGFKRWQISKLKDGDSDAPP